MSDADRDHGDESPTAKRYWAIEECHETWDTTGVSHHVVARNMSHVFEVLMSTDFCDAKRVEITEMTIEQASMLHVVDVDHGWERYKFIEAPMGSLFSEEY